MDWPFDEPNFLAPLALESPQPERTYVSPEEIGSNSQSKWIDRIHTSNPTVALSVMDGIVASGGRSQSQPSMEPNIGSQKRTGRKGRSMCPACRRAKRGLECRDDPDDPSGPCIECKERFKNDAVKECGPRTMPGKRQRCTVTTDIPVVQEQRDFHVSIDLLKEIADLKAGLAKVRASLDALLRQQEFGRSVAGESRVHGFGHHNNASQANYAGFRDPDLILETVSSCVPMEIAFLITESMERHYGKTNASITGLRASVLYPDEGKESWPIVEWREGAEIEVTAIFKVEREGVPCGHLMHFGYGVGWQLNGKRYKNATLEWKVTRIEHLKELLLVAQHSLGTLYWPKNEGLKVSIEGNLQNCSREDVAMYSRFLVSNLLKSTQIHSDFDASAARLLEQFSSKERNYPRFCRLIKAIEGRDGQLEMLCASLPVDY